MSVCAGGDGGSNRAVRRDPSMPIHSSQPGNTFFGERQKALADSFICSARRDPSAHLLFGGSMYVLMGGLVCDLSKTTPFWPSIPDANPDESFEESSFVWFDDFCLLWRICLLILLVLLIYTWKCCGACRVVFGAMLSRQFTWLT